MIFVAEIVDSTKKVIWSSSEFVIGSDVKIIENPLIIKENLEETADSDILDETKDDIKDDTTSQPPIPSETTETPNIEERSVIKEKDSTSNIILPTHILSSGSGISILPFQRHIWSEEIEISVKKSNGLGTLIISEKNTGHVFIKSTLEIR